MEKTDLVFEWKENIGHRWTDTVNNRVIMDKNGTWRLERLRLRPRNGRRVWGPEKFCRLEGCYAPRAIRAIIARDWPGSSIPAEALKFMHQAFFKLNGYRADD